MDEVTKHGLDVEEEAYALPPEELLDDEPEDLEIKHGMKVFSPRVMETDYGHRAMVAHLKNGAKTPGWEFDTSTEVEGVTLADGKTYMVLFNAIEILDVYRVTNQGALKRIKQRIPKQIQEYYAKAHWQS